MKSIKIVILFVFFISAAKVYSLFNIKKTMLLIAVIMDKQNQKKNSIDKQDIMKSFIQNYNNLDSNILTEMSKVIVE